MLTRRLPHWIAVVLISMLALACSREEPEKVVVKDPRFEAREQARQESVAAETSEEGGSGMSAGAPSPAAPETDVKPSQAKEGDLFLVRLEIDAERRLPDLLAVDLLPAGFELENQNLADSVKVDELQFDGKTIAEWQREQDNVQHTEFRDDRFVAAVDQSEWKSTNLFYIARAVTPGNYQVPPPYVEDMYNPERFAIGENPLAQMRVIGKQ